MTASVGEALNEMTRAGLGFTAVVDLKHQVVGIFTDGDLRRLLDEPRYIHGIPIVDAMTKNCRTVKAHALVGEALQLMESKKVNALPVVDSENRLVGGINMSDMLRAGVF
jgi:arabinose-5-phosphate isomerase